MKKKIVVIWDFDGPIGQINATYPYNFNFSNLEAEICNVRWLLTELKRRNIICCFAVTGFSAEQGVYPFNVPELIEEISMEGHEIASHGWKHEWIPLFKQGQVDKSLRRSKKVLEEAINERQRVTGFVPPHNRPMSWIKRGAFSLGDRGLYPFFKMGDNEQLIKLLKKNEYGWVRVSFKHRLKAVFSKKRNITGRVFNYHGFLILENHYPGFDQKVIDHILSTNHETYTISAHPYMLSLENKIESKEHFLNFMDVLLASGQSIEFVTPSQLVI
ncbi:polysaccharide deacetylase family protein [Aestuariibaculum suncheonense]|uniref:Polysaccharide deacetylase family protein n=1 Tax=Aestuariibaculum suncheonense TaxID=1028745 RepID=A0A8J6UCY1_9FLAO|nr:polysaccharide deacetylase family protein [Aestuariibaculum suncheonense]MBD0837000.1 polysaccharide deacetylase family protein [Aestuariibaculum suncheonense]